MQFFQENESDVNLCYDEKKDEPINFRLKKESGKIYLERVNEFGKPGETLAVICVKDGFIKIDNPWGNFSLN